MARGLAINDCEVTVITAYPHYPHGNIPKKYRWKPVNIEFMDGFKVIRTFILPLKSEGFIKRLLLIGSFAISSLFAMPFFRNAEVIWASSWIPGYIYSKIKRKTLALNVDDLTLEDLVDLKLIDKDSFLLKAGVTVFKFFFVKADILTPISKGYFEIMTKKYYVKPERIQLVRGGVDLSTFKPITVKRVPNSKFVVMYSGAFSVAYDFEQIIKAAKIIEAKDREVEFVIQGGGELLGSMQNLLKKFDVKNVRIINKIISRAEVARQLGSADILILPLAPFYKSGQPYRGMSSKLYEYQAVGKPIISCSKGIPSDYVVETKSGLEVNPGDPTGLANAVLALKKQPSLALIMGENGRKYVESEATIEAIGLKMRTIFIESMNRKSLSTYKQASDDSKDYLNNCNVNSC